MSIYNGSRALAAFNGCPNQQLVRRSANSLAAVSFSRKYIAICPRFPEGKEFVSELDINYEPSKQVAAVGMGCHECPFARDEKGELRRRQLVDMLHPDISVMSGTLFIARHYPQAVLFGNIAVKERMRAMTGYETTTQAKGKGGLRFPGAPEHVDGMQQDMASFLLMSIDAARNRSAHSLPDFPADPVLAEKIAYGQLNVASLAMFYLDTAEIKTEER